MTKELKRRIDRLFSGSNAELHHVLQLIDSGKYYDELTEEEKAAYNQYRGFGAGFEALNAAYAATMGIDPADVRTKLERNPTPAEQAAMREDLERYMRESVERYNSPEEVAKRKAEYEELQRIGELRRMDCLCGRDMDKCHPLPW
jgi:hypothetical protein